MAVSNLRRTKPVEGGSEGIFSDFRENSISLTSIEIRTASSMLDSYPYNGQRIYQGNLEYEEPSRYGPGRTISLGFEFRSDSNIFILKTDIDLPIGDLINELNSISPKQFQIYRNLTPKRENLWKFFRNSDKLVEMTVLGPDGEELDVVQLDEPTEEIAKEYPIESVTAIYDYEDRDIVARYTGGTINIDSDDPDANEFIIQLFERDVVGEREG